MYEVADDRYCYRRSTVLKNIPGHRSQRDLDLFEAAITAQRAQEPLPASRLSQAHYRAIHRHLFQDVYRWAGRYREVRIGKGASMFCYPEHIPNQMSELFEGLKARRYLTERSREGFVRGAANFLAQLNAIHAFRDGNGPTQLAFMALLAHRAGHPLKLERLEPEPFLAAMVRSFVADEAALREQLDELTR